MRGIHNNKNNAVMYKLPESDDMAFCCSFAGIITRHDYDHCFVAGIKDIIDKRGALYMVMDFRDHEGWEEDAMIRDLETQLEHGPQVQRLAIVDAPEKFRLKMKLMADHTSGEVRYFDADDYARAVNWVKTGEAEDAKTA